MSSSVDLSALRATLYAVQIPKTRKGGYDFNAADAVISSLNDRVLSLTQELNDARSRSVVMPDPAQAAAIEQLTTQLAAVRGQLQAELDKPHPAPIADETTSAHNEWLQQELLRVQGERDDAEMALTAALRPAATFEPDPVAAAELVVLHGALEASEANCRALQDRLNDALAIQLQPQADPMLLAEVTRLQNANATLQTALTAALEQAHAPAPPPEPADALLIAQLAAVEAELLEATTDRDSARLALTATQTRLADLEVIARRQMAPAAHSSSSSTPATDTAPVAQVTGKPVKGSFQWAAWKWPGLAALGIVMPLLAFIAI